MTLYLYFSHATTHHRWNGISNVLFNPCKYAREKEDLSHSEIKEKLTYFFFIYFFWLSLWTIRVRVSNKFSVAFSSPPNQLQISQTRKSLLLLLLLHYHRRHLLLGSKNWFWIRTSLRRFRRFRCSMRMEQSWMCCSVWMCDSLGFHLLNQVQ